MAGVFYFPGCSILFPCRFFSTSKYIHGHVKKLPFVNIGYKNWKNALETGKGILQHEKSASHKDSYVRWEDFKKSVSQDTSIMKDLTKAHTREVNENRHYIKTIAQVLLLTAKTKIAQREHRYSSDYINHGNVREILYIIAQKDSIVRKKIEGPRNARYLHPSIQNELLSIMADLVREGIAQSIKGSPFSIMADETKDLSKTEQLSVVIRFFHEQMVQERFLKFYRADSLDAESLTGYIFQVLTSLGIDKTYCVGQGYDGASVMSGRLNGVQARIKKEVPCALYIHCMSHRLNLVIVDTVKNVQAANEFFVKLEKLYVFCSTSVVHSVFTNVQQEMSNKPAIKLKQLSDTRWTCQHAACNAVLKTLDPLLETLNILSEGNNTERAVEAKSIRQFIDFGFILALVFFENILKRAQTLSDLLQAKDLDLASAVFLVQAVIQELEEVRNPENEPEASANSGTIESVWEETIQLSMKYGIPAPNDSTEPPFKKRDRRSPLHLRNSIILETVGQRQQLIKKDDFIKMFMYDVLDRIISELKSRFSKDSLEIMEGVQSLNPRSDSFLNFDKLLPMAKFYACNIENLEIELRQAMLTLQRKKSSDAIKVDTILDFTNFLEPYSVPFLELYRLCKITCVLPVSSASCERSFSALKLIKSFLRTTMTDERLSDLATLAIEARLASQINMDDVVRRFASNHKNSRLSLY
ncbi:LOW QUALITY PROTEIN: zinc finger MYM-type protein 1-like [Rhinophrynus dorsalis]